VPKNAGQLKLIKKTIAKILTIMNEKKKGKEESKKE
jgi:ribosomal protein L29